MSDGTCSVAYEKEIIAAHAAAAQATKDKYKKVPVFRGAIGRFPRAMREIAKVSIFGAKKHEVALGDMGYLDVPDAEEIYREAEGRHMTDEAIDGPYNEADGNLLHKAQKAWNALADLEVYLRNREREDADLAQKNLAQKNALADLEVYLRNREREDADLAQKQEDYR